jgi:hypothetical protein
MAVKRETKAAGEAKAAKENIGGGIGVSEMAKKMAAMLKENGHRKAES